MLELRDICKSYQVAENAVPALKNINLVFRDAEFVSILGQSGCGKTTMLNIIGGLDHFTSGDLFINGKSTKDYTSQDWDTYRNHTIGFVFQSYNLIPHQTVLQNVELALSISGIKKKERRALAKEALEKVGLGNHLNKHPNQLSGGQCQRVSIARALVNNPKIILADEPTGALDSDTSIQVMDLLKEISRDRLVIMVTHNPELATKYSTRIVRMLDGVVQEDSAPVDEKEYQQLIKNQQKEAVNAPETAKKERKSAMSYWTSMNLSLKNLLTKKKRTFLTAFACSIGIIGIAVILSVSAGMQAYVNSVQLDSASVNYVSVASRQTMMSNFFPQKSNLPEYPSDTTGVYPYTPTTTTKTQILSDKYLEYIDTNINQKDLVIATKYSRDTNLNIVSFDGTSYTKIATSGSGSSGVRFTEILDNPDYVAKEYTTLYKGADNKDFPTEYNEIALVVDKYNRVNTTYLRNLGITFDTDATLISYSQIVDHEVRLVLNDDYYTETTKAGVPCPVYNPASTQGELQNGYEHGIPLKIVCVLRQEAGANGDWLNPGIAYTPALTDYVMAQNANSAIVATQKANPTINVISTGSNITQATYESNLIRLGASSTPSEIRFYPKDFDSKAKIIQVLDDWNNTKIYEIYGTEKDEDDNYYADDYIVDYMDVSELLGSMLNDTINIITYALVAFSSISLVVSSIMIAIITYASVIERTKEIGVLRSLGARKKDISRVFIAEASIIGVVSTVIALILTLILNLIINIILGNLVGISTIASLNFGTAIAMIVLCIGLNVIASLIPASIASRKDPVVALRTE